MIMKSAEKNVFNQVAHLLSAASVRHIYRRFTQFSLNSFLCHKLRFFSHRWTQIDTDKSFDKSILIDLKKSVFICVYLWLKLNANCRMPRNLHTPKIVISRARAFARNHQCAERHFRRALRPENFAFVRFDYAF